MDIQREEILPGVYLTQKQTDKFKVDCLSVSLLTELNRGSVSANALLPRVLARGTAQYPDLDALNAYCDELYGARVLPYTRKLGEILVVSVYAGFLADRFTPDGERLLEPTAALLGEMLLHPALDDGTLRTDYVESEKEKLIDDIRAKINDKRSYAVQRMVELMCAMEAYGCDDLGTEDGVSELTPAELTAHYYRLLETSPMEVFYCGGANPERVRKAVMDMLKGLPRGELDENIGTDIRMNPLEESPRFFEETMDVTQGKLSLGFRLGSCMAEPNFPAIRVFNALYGGSVTSRLFLNVREKLSLCYYASSACDSRKGVMLVSSGIDSENFTKAKEEILAQLESIRQGDFTDEELNAARRITASDLRSRTDFPSALEAFYLSQLLLGLDWSPEEMAALCEQVTAEEIKAVASGIALDTVYFLHGGEEDGHAET